MVGQTVGKYRIVSRLGRGGMGTVYKAVDETLEREVAIKCLNPDLAEPEIFKRFRAEAKTLARLNHPHIATLFELADHAGDLLMVMEFVRGETFDKTSVRLGPMPVDRAARLCAQVLDALAFAHRAGIVHRDLKPANLMLTETGLAKVMDFGIARMVGTEHLTLDGFMMGTPAYMAPEQALGGEIDGRTDLYAMGVVFYRLLTAHLPFKADSGMAMVHKQINDPPTPVRQFRADLPAVVQEILTRAMAKAPEDRYQTAEEFRDALAALAGVGAADMTSTRPMPVAADSPDLEATLPMPTPIVLANPTLSAQPTMTQPAMVKPPVAPPPVVPPPVTPSMVATLPVGPPPVTPSMVATLPVGPPPVTPSMVATLPVGPPPVTPSMVATLPVGPSPAMERPPAPAAGPARPAAAAPAPVVPLAAPKPVSSTPKAVSSTPKPVSSTPKPPSSTQPAPARRVPVAAVALLVVAGVAAIGVVAWRATRSAPEPETTKSANAPAVPDAATTPAPANTPDAASPPNAAITPPAASTPAVEPAAVKPAPAPNAASAKARPPKRAVAASSAAAPPPPVVTEVRQSETATSREEPVVSAPPPARVGLPPVTFAKLRFLATADGEGRDRDASLRLGSEGLQVVDGTQTLHSAAYEDVIGIFHSHSREPKWVTPSGATASVAKAGGKFSFLKGAPDWVTLRTKNAFIPLRVPGDDLDRVIAALEARTGTKIVRTR